MHNAFYKVQDAQCKMHNARCKIYNAFVLLFGIGVWVNLLNLRNLFFLFFETVGAGRSLRLGFWDAAPGGRRSAVGGRTGSAGLDAPGGSH